MDIAAFVMDFYIAYCYIDVMDELRECIDATKKYQARANASRSFAKDMKRIIEWRHVVRFIHL